MKITNKLINENVKHKADDIIHLDLCNLGIVSIENLDSCPNLKHLILRHNDLNCLIGLEKCRQLWRLEVNNNKIKSLEGLSKFVAIGTLNLHSNDFNWNELEKIRHLHIVDLITSNNPKLDKDPNYRFHLIDCLPNVWMIDGLLVTTAERNQVADFFEESALSSRPIVFDFSLIVNEFLKRKKLAKYHFVPSDLKKRDVYGLWSTSLMTKFPINETKNIETDYRRLEFIAEWFEDIILIEWKQYLEKNINVDIYELNRNFLRQLIDFRKKNTEMCNMILVLLVASLQFNIPFEFLEETLAFTNLNRINDSYDTMRLFKLTRLCRIYIANLLLSAVKIDRDQNNESGFYENLFMALRNLLNEHFRDLNNSLPSTYNQNDFFSNQQNREIYTANTLLKDNQSLLSTEIIQLFCIVPSFYEYLLKSEGLTSVLKMSIGEEQLFKAVQDLLDECQKQDKPKKQICEEIGTFITSLLKRNVRQLINKKSKRKKSSISFLTPNETPDLGDLASIVPATSSSNVVTNTSNNGTLTTTTSVSHPTTTTVAATSALGAVSSSQNNFAQLSHDLQISSIKPHVVPTFPAHPVPFTGSGNLAKSSTADTIKDIPNVSSSSGNLANSNHETHKHSPAIGESLIIGRKKVGKIFKLNKEDSASVKFDIKYEEFKEFFTNDKSLQIDMKNFEWDSVKNFWRPSKSTGDINSFVYEGDIKQSLKNLKTKENSVNNNSINLNMFNEFENSLNEGNETNNSNLNNSKTAFDEPENNISSNLLNINFDKFENIKTAHSVTFENNSSRQNGKPNNVVSLELTANSSNYGSVFGQRVNQVHIVQPVLVNSNHSPFMSPKSSRNFPAVKLSNNKMKSPALKSKSHYERLSNGKQLHHQQQQQHQQPLNKSSEFIQKWTDDELNATHPAVNNNTANNNNNISTNNLFRSNNHGNLKDSSSLNDLTTSESKQNNIHVTIMPLQVDSIIDSIEPLNQNGKNTFDSIDGDRKHTNSMIINEEIQTTRRSDNQNDSLDTELKKRDAKVSCIQCYSVQYERRSRSHSPLDIKAASSSNEINKNIYNLSDYKCQPNNNNNNKPVVTTNIAIKKNQFIKLKDCTTWLTISDGRNLNSKINISTNNHRFLNGSKLTDSNFNRITMLLNRQNNRVNTSPKMPVLTSPSSKAHDMYKGMRPNNTSKEFNVLLIRKFKSMSSNS